MERDRIKNWFDKNGSRDFEYTYVYTEMNKVLQAAGRVIRSENDRGLVLLIDDRFSQLRYKKMFPLEWQGAANVKPAEIIAEKAN